MLCSIRDLNSTFYRNALEIVEEAEIEGEQVEDEEQRGLQWKGENLGSTVKNVTTNIIKAPVALLNSLKRVGMIKPDEVNLGNNVLDTVVNTSVTVFEFAITILFMISSCGMHAFPWIWILIGSAKFNSGWGNLEFMVIVMAYMIMKWQPNFYGLTVFGMGYMPF